MQEKTKQWLNDFFILNAGTLLTAVGSYFFKFPNNFSTGGVTGISVVLTHYFPGLSNGTIVSVINIALLIVGLLLLGKGFGFKTFYVTVAFSAMLKILEVIWPMTQPLTDQPFMELLLGVFLPAWGSALLFNIGSSTGGTDIIAMIVKKYFKCHIGRALLIVDFFITLLTFVAFGPETGLFSMVGLFIPFLCGGPVPGEHEHLQIFHHHHRQAAGNLQLHHRCAAPRRDRLPGGGPLQAHRKDGHHDGAGQKSRRCTCRM